MKGETTKAGIEPGTSDKGKSLPYQLSHLFTYYSINLIIAFLVVLKVVK